MPEPPGTAAVGYDAWAIRIQAEIRDLLAARTALAETVTAGRDGLLMEPQDGQGALLRREISGSHVTWLQVNDVGVYYHERVWHRERRWHAPRTPGLIARIEALVGKVARLQADCKAIGRPWYDMVKAAVTGVDQPHADRYND